tara:strand:- start:14 stop:487 length:474 start_codon:yes stop_codon:yes gene_type:complete
MKLKNKLLILILLLTTILLSIINLKNTSKTNLYFLNFKSEKITLGNFISLSFFTGFITTYTFLYITSSKKETQNLPYEELEINAKSSIDDIKENNMQRKQEISERPPERDIRESQPTISVNYRVIKQNDVEVNDINEGFRENRNQNYDDWEEIESNW